jgi:hypothetical protein
MLSDVLQCVRGSELQRVGVGGRQRVLEVTAEGGGRRHPLAWDGTGRSMSQVVGGRQTIDRQIESCGGARRSAGMRIAMTLLEHPSSAAARPPRDVDVNGSGAAATRQRRRLGLAAALLGAVAVVDVRTALLAARRRLEGRQWLGVLAARGRHVVVVALDGCQGAARGGGGVAARRARPPRPARPRPAAAASARAARRSPRQHAARVGLIALDRAQKRLKRRDVARVLGVGERDLRRAPRACTRPPRRRCARDAQPRPLPAAAASRPSSMPWDDAIALPRGRSRLPPG